MSTLAAHTHIPPAAASTPGRPLSDDGQRGTASVDAADPTVCRTASAVAVADLDEELRAAVRHTGQLRRGFYLVVLLVALAGQVSGAVQTLHIPLLFAIPAVAALELGGVVVLADADVRRRLGERAIGSRILSAAIAAAAVTFNWLAHPDRLLGGFFAGMSLLGYLVWLTHAGNSRRDRLRARNALPPTTPAYEILGHWLRHPQLTRQAKSLAKADPTLGLYASLAAAREHLHTERRRAAISTVLRRKIRAAVGPITADIAVHVYDLDRIADRLAAQADYDTLTALIATDLTPTRLAAASTSRMSRIRWRRHPIDPGVRQPATGGPDRGLDRGAGCDAGGPSDDRSASPSDAAVSLPTRSDRPPAARTTSLRAAGPAARPTRDRDGTAGVAATVATSPAVHPAQTAPRGPAVGHRASGDSTQGDNRTGERAAAPPPGVPGMPAGGVDAMAGADSRRPLPGPTPPAHAGEVSGDTVPPGGPRHPDSPTPDANDGSVPRQTAAAVAYWYRRDASLHPREIAARIGRSERTVRRHWPPAANTDADR